MAEPVIYHIDVNSAYLSWEAARRLSENPNATDIRTIPAAIGGNEEMRHGIVHPCKGGILGVSPGVVYGAAIEYETAAVAALVAGDAHAV